MGARDRPGDSGTHRLCRAALHRVWDSGFSPAVEVEPGDVVELGAPDASDGQIGERSEAADLAGIDFSRLNPVAGPIFVRGARPGDAIEVEMLELRTREWGWTGIAPGFGLLADDFPDPWLRISGVSSAGVAFADGVTLPCRPFPGTIGVVPPEPGPHPILPPSRYGGNIDVKDLTAGSAVLLPVGVEGALLSIGDGHAAQGDGEVCGSAIETGIEVAIRVRLHRDRPLAGPQLIVPAQPEPPLAGRHITLGVADDLKEASRDAVRAMIDHLCARFGMEAEEAYALTSVAADLRVHEVVNAPRWVVGAAIPEGIFATGRRRSAI